MFTSAELVEALRRRLRRSIRPERPAGEFPPGWQAWFDGLKAKTGRVTGATTDAVLAIFIAREPVYPQGYERLNRWQAFTRLWRSDWRETGRDDRGARIAAMVLTLLFHVLWVASLMWLMFMRFVGYVPEEDPGRGEESVVQVEFIGKGTPEDDAGGAPPEVAETIEAPASQPQAAQPSPPDVAAIPPLPDPANAPPQPSPPQPPQPAEQPLQVTETPVPDSDFVLSAPRIAQTPAPRIVAPDVAVPQTEIRVVELPSPPPVLRPLPQREVTVPEVPRPQAEAIVRDVPAPPPRVELRPLVTRPGIAAPELRRDAPEVSSRAIPVRAPPGNASTTSSRPGTTGEGDAATPSPASSSQAGTQGAGTPAPGSGEGARPAARASGSGPGDTAARGAVPTPGRGDDWGDSTRNRPGGSSGLFNADGSPRLAGNDGRVGGGLPPGTITEDYEKIDRMGTWLKRPPIGYEPTAFDRFWVPHETLLQEWVRRSIKEVLIPIPGTSKKIRCAVALLALGGACDITDPNMRDVEAEARKPPDVPFKPELQENRDSLVQPPATP